jgi:hypothetical protein
VLRTRRAYPGPPEYACAPLFDQFAEGCPSGLFCQRVF